MKVLISLVLYFLGSAVCVGFGWFQLQDAINSGFAVLFVCLIQLTLFMLELLKETLRVRKELSINEKKNR